MNALADSRPSQIRGKIADGAVELVAALLGAAMDSAYKIIEMLEERFGRPVATALLAIVGLGLAAWSAHTIAVDLIIPGSGVAVNIWNYFSHSSTKLPRNFISAISTITYSFVFANFVLAIMMLVRQLKIGETFRGLHTEVEDLSFKQRNFVSDLIERHETDAAQIKLLEEENERLRAASGGRLL
jgi:hypothetical protein